MSSIQEKRQEIFRLRSLLADAEQKLIQEQKDNWQRVGRKVLKELLIKNSYYWKDKKSVRVMSGTIYTAIVFDRDPYFGYATLTKNNAMSFVTKEFKTHYGDHRLSYDKQIYVHKEDYMKL